MCYPKPGPRCSSYAATRLAKAKTALETQKEQSFADYQKLSAVVEEAQTEFDITPAGLRFLEDEVLQGEHKADEQARYVYAVALRKQRLEQVKALDPKAEPHSHSIYYSPSRSVAFLDPNTPRVDEDPKELRNRMTSEAEAWLSHMSEEEMTQMRWMTDYGAMEANTHIGGSNDYTILKGVYTPQDIERRMKEADSAISKYDSKQEEIVYRGVRQGALPKHMINNYRVSNEEKKAEYLKAFTVGKTIGSKFYMPTSSQPSLASGFSDFDVVLEIKTVKSVPVSSLSISPRENERLIGRNSAFKVLNIHENVPFGTRGVRKTVIQLEQL